jgi:hypothetical protein
MSSDDSDFLALSKTAQFKRCYERSLWAARIQGVKKTAGYSVREAEEMIQKLRKEKFSGDYKDIREEAIRRVRMTIG